MFTTYSDIAWLGRAKAEFDKHFEEIEDYFMDGQGEIHPSPDVVFARTGRIYDDNMIRNFRPKVIASNTTGDSHIDTEYCKDKCIEVITLKDDDIMYELTAVPELTIGLIIALTRNLMPAINSVKTGEWDRYPFCGKKMLSEMSLGIWGLGRIGQMIDDYYNLIPSINVYDSEDCIGSDMDAVLGSDIVTVHIPVDGNEGLFDEKMFSKIKDGAYFINTSRGEIVDELALVRALESGKLAGAATDVISGEFEPGFNVKNSPLWHYAQAHDNLLICPHIGGSTEDSWEKTQIRIIEKVLEFLG